MSQSQHILRKLRLQLKTGFLRKETSAYAFLKRYPPLSRDGAPPVREVDNRNIPYYKLYEKAIAKNPLYADEKVYPAYRAHEPQALTLAKKQYEYMELGDNEAEAYEKAVKFVEIKENEAYDGLKKLMSDIGESLGGVEVKLPFLATGGDDLSIQMALFREQLSKTAYYDLDLADQGEIDYFLQTKVLQWNEVERERRMKDPIFVRQFEKLRASLLPETGVARENDREKRHAEYKEKMLQFYNINKARLCTAKPFYYEEYAGYFAKLKKQPLLGKWNEAERTEFSHWIIDTLAVREMLERNTTSVIQSYLDQLRAHFFPMVKYPDRVGSYELPSRDQVKQLLYDNDVGYKTQEGKMFIRRYYLLPQLTFPLETVATTISSDKRRLREALDKENSLLDEMRSAGFDEQSIPELQEQLREYISAVQPDPIVGLGEGGRGGHARGTGGRGADSTDMSTLDALLHDDDGLDMPSVNNVSEGANGPEPSAADEATEGASGAGTSGRASSEWQAVIDSYIRPPSTPLETERQELLRSFEYHAPEDLTTEAELGALQRARTETELLARARLAVVYEQKEAARRVREWQRRGVAMDSLPAPALELTDNST
jgi:hypothetical protein